MITAHLRSAFVCLFWLLCQLAPSMAAASPTIDSFNPGTGPAGTTVTITGTNFSTTPSNDLVGFNGANGVVTAATSTSLTVTVPPGASTGQLTLAVQSAQNIALATCTIQTSESPSLISQGKQLSLGTGNCIFVVPVNITGFGQPSGKAGDTITINGTGFSPTPLENTVKFFDDVAATVTAATATSLTVTIPSYASTGPVTVSVNGTLSKPSDFTVATPPDGERRITAATVTPAQDYSDEFIRQRSAVTALGPSLFGDNTGLSSGVTEFATTDVEVPGNTGLAVRIARRYRVDYRTAPLTGKAAGLFNDWDLDIPHLHGTFAYTPGNATSGWQVSTPGQPNQRCSVDTNNPLQAIPPAVNGDGSLPYAFQGYQYWHDNSLYIPGQGDQTLMVISPGNTNRPSDGADYHWLTSNQWMVSCLATTANGIPGESFLVVSPDGTKYRFDWFAKVYAGSLIATGGTFPNSWESDLARQEQYVFPTRIEDRFGNYVTYTYDPSQPMRLQSIHASDGRDITLTYNPAGTIDTAKTTDAASVVTKTWTYVYAANGSLYQVILPDSSKWQFDMGAGIGGGAIGWRNCADINLPASGTVVKTITHPSGAVGAFTFQTVRLGRSYVPKNCGFVGSNSSPLESKYVDVVALTRKQISGPGMATPSVWTFAYGADNASWTSDCTMARCATTRQITATEADGSSKRYTFSNRYDAEEGLLLSVEVLNAAAAVVKSEVIDYQRDATGQPYPARLGKKPCYYCDTSGELLIPSKSRVITQQGATFSAVVSAFDVFANPATVTRSSSLGYSRGETTLYHHDTAHWVLHQVQTVTEGSTGAVMQSNVYDPLTATLTSTRQFGQPATTMTYYTDGTLWTQKDGAGHTTTFSSYKRGLPQTIGFADGNSISVVVNDFGQITSLKNAAGYTTAYEHDLGGRLSKVTYPAGDSVAWNTTTQTFAPVTVAEYGLSAGHWKQVTTTGNAIKEKYFDAFWRPVVTTEYDSLDKTNTQDTLVQGYDAAGRLNYTSYPQRTVVSYSDRSNTTNKTYGVLTTYDALGRATQTQTDSELGSLLTTTVYSTTNFTKSVTNPRGKITTYSFQAFDQPSYDAPYQITAPETLSVTINRDVFGKPTSIVRSGTSQADGTAVAATRSYVYDAYQRLCKTFDPEIGASVRDYDAANNVAWTSTGFPALTNLSQCDRTDSGVVAAQVARTYDTLNRLTDITGVAQPVHRTYTPDGLDQTVSAGSVVWTYGYNKRRLLTSESLSGTGVLAASLANDYDANGNLQTLSYPDGLQLNYAPNALGEPTKVQKVGTQNTYANTIVTYANGAIQGFNYGNGIAHSLTQNARGLPLESKDAGVLDDVYTYDANANVTNIADQFQSVSTRSMTYDGLDRLSTANDVGIWGNATYAYDALDNLRTSTVGARSYTHVYDATNKLQSLMAGPTTVMAFTYGQRGNLHTRGTQTFAFDPANEMQWTTGPQPANNESYAYDGVGRRVTVTRAADGTHHYMVYSQSGQLRYEMDDRTGSMTDYIYLGDSLIAREDNAPPTIPLAPTVITPATNTTGSYTVSYSAAGASTYSLQENGIVIVDNLAATSYTASLRGNGTYQYQAKACNAAGCSAYGPIATTVVSGVSTPSTPGGMVGNPNPSNTGNFELRWPSVAGATTYTVQENANGAGWIDLPALSGTLKAITSKTTGSYQYHVRACSTGCSAYTSAITETVTIVSVPTAPTLTVPASSTSGSFSISRGTSTGATSYELQELTSTGWSWTSLSTSMPTPYALTRGTGTYSYQARACNANGCGDFGTPGTITVTLANAPPTPTGLSASPNPSSTGTYGVTWNASTGASSYVLEWNPNSAGWSQRYSGTGQSKSESGMTPGIYSYRVSACVNGTTCSAPSAVVNETVTVAGAPPVPTGLSATPNPSQNGFYTVSWNASTGATSYVLEWNPNSVGWSQRYSGAALSKAESGITAGAYSYRVSACVNGTTCSAPSASINVTEDAAPLPVSSMSASPNPSTDGNYTVVWTAPIGANFYYLDEQLNGGTWNSAAPASQTLTSATFTGRGAGTYGYRIRACRFTDQVRCSTYSATITEPVQIVGAPPAPASITGPTGCTVAPRTYGIAWAPVTGVTSYNVHETVDVGGVDQILPSTGTSITLTRGLKIGGVHYDSVNYAYEVQACNGSVCSGWRGTAYACVGISNNRPALLPVTTVKYLHTDGLRSPVAESDSTGTVTKRTRYEPYGAPTAGYVDGPGFTGHYTDTATQLTYMQQRYYDPIAGRFLSRDPVTIDSGTGANFNRYWYANNNPYKFTDPDGRDNELGVLATFSRAEKPTAGDIAGLADVQKSVDLTIEAVVKTGNQDIIDDAKVWKVEFDPTYVVKDHPTAAADTVTQGTKGDDKEISTVYGKNFSPSVNGNGSMKASDGVTTKTKNAKLLDIGGHELSHGSEGNRKIHSDKDSEADVGKRVREILKASPTVKKDEYQ